jgi:hypothetical protein
MIASWSIYHHYVHGFANYAGLQQTQHGQHAGFVVINKMITLGE